MNFVTEERITDGFDAYMSQFPNEVGFKNTLQISKENDGKYYVHVCKMQYKMGQWRLASILKSENIYQLIKDLLCKKKS